MKSVTRKGLLALATAGGQGLSACANQQQMLSKRQDVAIDTALQRGRFDLNCPAATAVVLSKDFIQPAVQGPWAGGIQRLEYTIGIEGCNKRTTLVVICQQGTDTCIAVNPAGRSQGQ